MKHLVVVVAFALSVTACAPVVPLVVVSPAPSSTREPKPAKDVMDEAAVTPRDGAGAIVITTRAVWLGKRCTYDVALDDQHVAGLRPGERVTIYANPGARVLDVSIRDEGGCDAANAQVALDVVAHATSRILVGSDRHYDLKVEVNALGGSLPE
jgi:hypothetical protein